MFEKLAVRILYETLKTIDINILRTTTVLFKVVTHLGTQTLMRTIILAAFVACNCVPLLVWWSSDGNIMQPNLSD